MENTKVCFKCKVEKPISSFYQHPQMRDGHLGKCKECTKKDVKENTEKRRDYYNRYDTNRYRENISRYFSSKYSGMKKRVSGKDKKSRTAGKELCSKKDFIQWCMQPNNYSSFLVLYERWRKSGYVIRKSPSIDRIDNQKGYLVDNLQWLTQQQNSRKYIF